MDMMYEQGASHLPLLLNNSSNCYQIVLITAVVASPEFQKMYNTEYNIITG